jgi:hypothetical protein
MDENKKINVFNIVLHYAYKFRIIVRCKYFEILYFCIFLFYFYNFMYLNKKNYYFNSRLKFIT